MSDPRRLSSPAHALAGRMLEQARGAFEKMHSDEGLALLRVGLEQLAPFEDSESIALRHRLNAMRLFYEGDVDGALAEQDALIVGLRAAGDRAGLAEALIQAAGARIASGREGADSLIESGLVEARSIGDLGLQARAWCNQAMLANRRARPGEAVVHAAAAAEAARRSAQEEWLAAAQGTGSAARFELGDLTGARALAEEAIEGSTRAGKTRATAHGRLGLVSVLVALDALTEAREQIDAAATLATEPALLAKIALARAILARAEGNPDEAEAFAQEAFTRWSGLKDQGQLANAAALVIEISLERGQVAEAVSLTSSPAFSGAALPQRAVVAARVAQLALAPDMALQRAITAADICRGEGAAKLEDEALQLAIVAAHRADRLPDALAIALRLADARQNAARRVQDVSRAAQIAVKAVAAEAAAVDRRTGAAADEARGRADRERQISALESVAHSARNSLAAISASGEMMAADPPPVDRAVLLSRLLDGVDRLGAQLERALDEARGRDVAAENTVTLLAPLAYRVADVFAAAATRKGIQLQVRVIDPLVSTAPPDDVREILENLVSNAVKFCSAGDTVRVAVYRFGVLAVLEVSDDGPGIPESDQPRLFSRYGTLSPRPTGGEASSGLGLSQVQTLAEAHGGSVTVQSRAGVGSSFKVSLPLG